MGTEVSAGGRDPIALLQVTGGAHSGVTLPLQSETLRVGASAESDIVLHDRDVAEDHAVLRINRGRLLIEARGGDVALSGGRLVPKGQGCRVRLPADIRIGGGSLRLVEASPRPAWMQPPIAAVACVALLLIASIVATQAGLIGANPAGGATAAAVAPAPTVVAQTPVADPMTSLRQRLDAAPGLAGLKVEADGARLVVHGAIEDAARPSWAAAQQWFDKSFGGRYVLASDVTAKSAMARPRFQLQAIWFGPSPYVVTADGQRRYAGSTLGDGWVLKAIQENKIVVAKANEEMSLNY